MQLIVRLQILAIALLALSNCSTSIDGLTTKSSTQNVTRNYAENYQTVYQRVRKMSLQCNDGVVSPTATANVDAEIFSDLGYAEISNRMNNYGVNNFYWYAKIEKLAEKQTRVTVFSGNTIDNSVALERVLGWANGSTRCNGE
jgi:hypothetical protein